MKIRNIKKLFQCPWLTLLEKEVEGPEGLWQHYSITQHDYVSVLAVTSSGKIPIVKQYRPAVDTYTYEFPSGLLDADETPLECAKRELLEETGLRTIEIKDLGSYNPDSGRMNNKIHNFFAITEEPNSSFKGEPGIEVFYWDWQDLKKAVFDKSFSHQIHIGIIFLAQLQGLPFPPSKG